MIGILVSSFELGWLSVLVDLTDISLNELYEFWQLYFYISSWVSEFTLERFNWDRFESCSEIVDPDLSLLPLIDLSGVGLTYALTASLIPLSKSSLCFIPLLLSPPELNLTPFPPLVALILFINTFGPYLSLKACGPIIDLPPNSVFLSYFLFELARFDIF